MAEKSPIQKLQEAVVGTALGAVSDPRGTAAKAAGQVRGVVSLGLTVAGVVANQVAERLAGSGSAPTPGGRPDLRVAEPPVREEPIAAPVPVPSTTGPTPEGTLEDGTEIPTPKDVARVVAKKAPPKKAAPATPSDRLPAKKTPAKKTPAKKTPAKKAPVTKAPAAKKTAATKAPAKKAAKKTAKKTPAKKTPAKKTAPTAAEVLEDTSVTTPVGTTGADVATNPSTTDTDLQQVGTEPLMDPATTKAVASEAAIGAKAADPDKR